MASALSADDTPVRLISSREIALAISPPLPSSAMRDDGSADVGSRSGECVATAPEAPTAGALLAMLALVASQPGRVDAARTRSARPPCAAGAARRRHPRHRCAAQCGRQPSGQLRRKEARELELGLEGVDKRKDVRRGRARVVVAVARNAGVLGEEVGDGAHRWSLRRHMMSVPVATRRDSGRRRAAAREARSWRSSAMRSCVSDTSSGSSQPSLRDCARRAPRR